MLAPACASTGHIVLTALHPPCSLLSFWPQGLGSRHIMPCLLGTLVTHMHATVGASLGSIVQWRLRWRVSVV